ncbi:MAG: site-specific DNA-methyltransferase [Muribaculaceae bacterium]|nr:site-specific DNA-methyltransferase [Muribaculaceae bacterium]
MVTNKVYNGCSEEVLKKIEDNSIDLVMTSPPYDDLRRYLAEKSSWNFKVFQNIADELIRVLKDGGVIVWNVNDKTEGGSETGTSFRQALYFMERGLKLNDTMIWMKPNPCPSFDHLPRYTQSFEYMYIFSKGTPKTFNPALIQCKSGSRHDKSTMRNGGGEYGTRDLDYIVNSHQVDYNVWEIAVAPNKKSFEVDGEQLKHSAVFPYELPFRHIQTWTNEGDVVLDPFAGSGTTLLAARDLNRKYIGIEMSEKYHKMINIRLEADFPISNERGYDLPAEEYALW